MPESAIGVPGVTGLVEPRFVYPGTSFATTAQLFATVGGDLADAGVVHDSFVEALASRERSYPTGLPVPGGVAIPHTDADHVVRNAIAVLTLASPLVFGAMAGAEDETVEVSTVFVLALAQIESQLSLLPRIVRSIQNPAFLAELGSACDRDVIAGLVNTAFGS